MKKALIALGTVVALAVVEKLCGMAYQQGLEEGHERGHRCVARALALSREVEVEHTVTFDGEVGHVPVVPMHGEN